MIDIFSAQHWGRGSRTPNCSAFTSFERAKDIRRLVAFQFFNQCRKRSRVGAEQNVAVGAEKVISASWTAPAFLLLWVFRERNEKRISLLSELMDESIRGRVNLGELN
jgi:hypothetical protein